MHADPVREATGRELDRRKQLKVSPPGEMGSQPKDVVNTRWALPQEEAEGAETVIARLVAKGYQGPDLRNGEMDIVGSVSPWWL